MIKISSFKQLNSMFYTVNMLSQIDIKTLRDMHTSIKPSKHCYFKCKANLHVKQKQSHEGKNLCVPIVLIIAYMTLHAVRLLSIISMF